MAVRFAGSLGLSCSLYCDAEDCVEIGCLLLDSDTVFSEMGVAYKRAVGLCRTSQGVIGRIVSSCNL